MAQPWYTRKLNDGRCLILQKPNAMMSLLGDERPRLGLCLEAERISLTWWNINVLDAWVAKEAVVTPTVQQSDLRLDSGLAQQSKQPG